MSGPSQRFADLADHTYDRGGVGLATLVGKDVQINGERYTIRSHTDNPASGYQGTIYQHMGSGDLVVAHRGTEFGREAFRDGVVADGGMVFARTNAQAADAVALTRAAIEMAQRDAVRDRTAPREVTVTGHSLGGTLAQITAHHFDLRGETFNAYGAASLDRRIPEGGTRVTNHVMAGDAVSAASPHYGKVVVYAAQSEINRLSVAGYHANPVLDVLRRDMPVAAAIANGGSHSMHHFLPVDGEGRRDVSALADPAMRRRADENSRVIEDYRGDIGGLRGAATFIGRGGVVGGVIDALDRARNPPVPAGTPAERERAVPGTDRGAGHATPARADPSRHADVQRLFESIQPGGDGARAALDQLRASSTGDAFAARVAEARAELAPVAAQAHAPQQDAGAHETSQIARG
ncbi:lipase family protein [Luteimonas deserti]|uniref:Lipase n=1 Tax=Luteimonas deserti TaxID=2752306 RepID=A0A7Z0QTJ7_9GAMM|nr:lipase [Luteimonas deserti]NYZ63510.1 lipase [Luteimonas deserti]